MTKTCNRCGEEKNETEFHFRNKKIGTRHGSCKPCQRDYTRQHYRRNRSYYKKKARRSGKVYIERNRAWLLEYLESRSCVDCGEDDNVVLEFDHLDADTKTANVSNLVSEGGSLKRLKEEVAKCEVVCANCHRRRTARRGGFWKHAAVAQ